MTSPLPVVKILVAFNNKQLDDITLITNTAVPGGPVGPVNWWTDITAYAPNGYSYTRGRQHELSSFDAGTATVDLDNRDGRFSPWVTTGPYFGLLKPGKPMRITATWNGVTYNRFTGYTTSWPQVWGDPVSIMAQLTATDGFRGLGRTNIVTDAYAQQVLADGAFALYRLSDSAGTVAPVESSGRTPPGVPVGAVTFGNPGFSDVSSDTSCELTWSTDNPGTQMAIRPTQTPVPNGTFEIWVNVQSNPFGALDVLAFSINVAAGAEINTVFFTNPGVIIEDGAAGGLRLITTLVDVVDAAWHHLALTWTTAGSTTATFYVDGLAILSNATLGHLSPPATGVRWLAFPQPGVANETTLAYENAAWYSTVLTPAQLANHVALGRLLQNVELSGQVVKDILFAVGWPANLENVDAGITRVQGVTNDQTSVAALSYMQDCESTEAGALFMANDGRVRFVSRNSLLTLTRYQTPNLIVGDSVSGGEIPFMPGPTIQLDDEDIYNIAQGTRSGGALQESTNAVSIGEYGPIVWTPSGTLLNVTDVEVLARTQWVLARYAEPTMRCEGVDVDVVGLLGETARNTFIAALFNLELMDRLTVNRHGAPGTAFSQLSELEGIAETVTADSWVVSLATTPADPNSYFILDQSHLDVGKLAY